MTIVKRLTTRLFPITLVLACISAGSLLGGCAAATQSAATPAVSQKGKVSNGTMPKDADALLVGAELALERNQYLQAAQWFAAAAAVSDDEALAERATTQAYKFHQDTYVLKSANRWLEINSSSEQARRFAGFAALRLFRIDEAAEHFQILIESAFISPQAGFVALAPQWFDQGSRPAVLALMKKLISKHENTAEAHFVLAQAALQAEDLQLALASAKRAAELSPYWAPTKSTLARVQLAVGQREAALATARAALEQDARIENKLEFAQLQFAAGQQAEARSTLDELSADASVGPIAQRSLAFIDLDAGQVDAAVKRWRSLVQSGRFVYEGMFFLGQIAEQRGETEDAIALYTRVASGDLSVGAQARAAFLKARATNVTDGVAVLRAFAKAHPEYAIEMITTEASLLSEMGQAKQGIALLDGAIAQYPDNDALRSTKALLLERNNRSSEAVKEMRALLKSRPDDPTALNMLGYTLVDRTSNVEEGFTMIRRALALMPDNGAILDSMGWALHQKRRDAEALPYLQRAHERARDAEIALHLGDVLWKLKRGDEAQKTWADALAAHPDNKDIKERVQKYQGKKP